MHGKLVVVFDDASAPAIPLGFWDLNFPLAFLVHEYGEGILGSVELVEAETQTRVKKTLRVTLPPRAVTNTAWAVLEEAKYVYREQHVLQPVG